MPYGFVFALCLAEILGMTGFSSFAALLPRFFAEWHLSGVQGGWISGIYFAGYVAAVPLLVSLTDRIAARRVYLAATALSGAGALGFALFADGFWSALLFQAITGAGLAGTYMPGLKALSDRLAGPSQARAVAFYTSSFGIGASLSYLVSGAIEAWLGWRWVFASAALGSAGAFAIAASLLPRDAAARPATPARLFDFRPALCHPCVLSYCLAYAAHNWELFGFRAWIVAFLAFNIHLRPGAGPAASPTVIATLATLSGVLSSIGGNEAATRFDRPRTISLIMGASALLGCLIGFAAGLPLPVVAGLCLLYAATVSGESASITAGLIAAAPPSHRGTAMALYSCIGFAGAFLGPLAFGAVLGVAGERSIVGWGCAFAVLGLGCALGPLALALTRRRERQPGTIVINQ